MSLSQFRAGCLLALACLFSWGCPDGADLYVPPQATAAPGGSRVFIYVAEGRRPSGTKGGGVSAYELGSDGFLPGGSPLSHVSVVNPRRITVHPGIPVLYVGTQNQILAFDISDGSLRSLCGGPEVGLAPPCATLPRGASSPVDMTVARDADGTFTLYVAESGVPNTIDFSRIAAYKLGDQGELPAYASSQGATGESFQFEGVGTDSLFVWGADTRVSRLYRFTREADGSLPLPAPTPYPPNLPTPSPSSTPNEDGPTPSPSSVPTPSPVYFNITFPKRMVVTQFNEANAENNLGFVYVVKKQAQTIASFGIDEFYDLPDSPGSETQADGDYEALIVSPDRSRLYGTLFREGGVVSYPIDENGEIESGRRTETLANPASYLTGLAWLEYTPPGGETEKVVFVSAGGLNRVDGYKVKTDGALERRPFTSTQPRDDVFPTDIAINILPPQS